MQRDMEKIMGAFFNLFENAPRGRKGDLLNAKGTTL
jgi:hypothetical protein